MANLTCINIIKNGRGRENAYVLLNKRTNKSITVVTSVLKKYMKNGLAAVDNLRLNGSDKIVLVKNVDNTSSSKLKKDNKINRQIVSLCKQLNLKVDYSGDYACSIPIPVFYGNGKMSLQSFEDKVDGEKEITRLVLTCYIVRMKLPLFKIEIASGTENDFNIKESDILKIKEYFEVGSRKPGYFKTNDNCSELIDLAADASILDTFNTQSISDACVSFILPKLASWCGVQRNVRDLLIRRYRYIEACKLDNVKNLMNKYGDDIDDRDFRQKAILACAIWENLFESGFKLQYYSINVKEILRKS